MQGTTAEPGDGQPSATARGVLSRGGASSEVGSGFLLGAIVGLLVARIPVILLRAIDNDEFEHAHAAWNVFTGLVPYKDFFEHHTPWYYFALAPFFHWFPVAESFDAARHFLIFGRFFSLALTALSAVLVFLLGRRGAGRREGLLAALFFVGQPVLIHKTLEIRPDVPALPFFIAALWFLRHALARETRRLRWSLGGGLCLGAAVMCTQKLLFALPGVFLGLGLWVLSAVPRGHHRLSRSRTAAVLVVALGVAAPTVVTWLGFALKGGGHQFIYDNFLLNAHWKWRTSRHLLVIVRTSWPILLLGLVGAWSALAKAGDRKRDDGDVLLLCALAGLAAGVAVVPVAYDQYFLPPLTIVCLFAARGLSLLLETSRHRARAWLLVGATVSLLIWPLLDLRREFGRRNEVQMARLQFVFAHTGPHDPVLDGWLGMDVFRPQPLYYSFMHRELQVSLPASEKEAYLDALTSGRVKPALIALDDELRALGPRFLQYVRRNYVSEDGVLYLPTRPAQEGPPAGARQRLTPSGSASSSANTTPDRAKVVLSPGRSVAR